MENHIICGIHITDRVKNARKVQDIFTAYGCQIRTRVGFHDVHKDACSPHGLIVLEMAGDKKKISEMVQQLKAIGGIQVQQMEFSHN